MAETVCLLTSTSTTPTAHKYSRTFSSTTCGNAPLPYRYHCVKLNALLADRVFKRAIEYIQYIQYNLYRIYTIEYIHAAETPVVGPDHAVGGAG